MSKQELVKKQDAMPAFMKEKMADDRGNEGVGAEDLTIPRIELCQALSKCRKKSDPAYIEGIEEGVLYNNITRQVYGADVIVVPVVFMVEYLLWRDQDLGGGFGGAFPNEAEAEAARNDQEAPDEWETVRTNQQFVLVCNSDGSVEEAVISMAKSKNKVSKNWNSLIRINGGPRFSRMYKLTGVADQNSAGQDYHNLTVHNYGFVDEKTFAIGEQVYGLITSGAVTVDRTIEGESSIEDAEVTEM